MEVQTHHLTTIRPPRKKGVRQFRVGNLTRAILSVLVERFCVRTTDLYQLLAPDEADPTHERSIRRSLKLLRDQLDPSDKKDPRDIKWGYIRSIPWTNAKVGNRFDYTIYAHGLTDRGVRLVHQLGLDPLGQAKSFQDFKPSTVDHELRLRDYLTIWRRQLDALGLELIVEQANIKGKTVAPDLLVHVYDPKMNLRSAPIFVEYEKQKRGKYQDGVPQVVTKLEHFAALYNTPLCQEEYGFRKFYVLVILQTDRKVDFLLRDLVGRKLALKMFMVVSEQATDLVGPTLRSPKDAATCKQCSRPEAEHTPKPGCQFTPTTYSIIDL